MTVLEPRSQPLSPASAMEGLRSVAGTMSTFTTLTDPRVTDALIAYARAIVAKSGAVDAVTRWQKEDRAARAAHAGGAPSIISTESVLILWKLVTLSNQNWYFTCVRDCIKALTPQQLVEVGLDPTKFADSKDDTIYNRAWDATQRLLLPLDAEPCPRRAALTKTEHADVVAHRNAIDCEKKRQRRVLLMNMLVNATTYALPRDVCRHYDGTYSVDATVYAMPGRARTNRSIWAGTVADAGWYRRDADPVTGHNATDGKGGLMKRTRGKVVWGLELEVVQAGSPGDDDTHPLLTHGVNFHVPAVGPAKSATEAFMVMAKLEPDRLRRRISPDMLYLPNANVDTFQRPLHDLGYEFAMDYPAADLGVQGGYGGALLVEGHFYCPAMQQPLIDAVSEWRQGIIDLETLKARIQERNLYRLREKETTPTRPRITTELGAPIEGSTKYRCPAAGPAPTLRCPFKPNRRGNPAKRLLTPMLPKNPDKVCTNRESLAIPNDYAIKYRQELPYMSDEWHDAYHRPRNTVEGVNRRIKSPAEGGLGSSDKRLARSVAAQILFATLSVIKSNTVRAFKWLADYVAPAGDPAPPQPPRGPHIPHDPGKPHEPLSGAPPGIGEQPMPAAA